MWHVDVRKAMVVTAVAVIAAVGGVKVAPAAEEPKTSNADWKRVEEALGKPGQVQPGGVYGVAMPRTDLLYMHFWANDDAVKLARGLRAALDLTNSKKADEPSK